MVTLVELSSSLCSLYGFSQCWCTAVAVARDQWLPVFFELECG